MLKNGFLTFCCAFIPGAGQMYQGYMKRGLSLILTACFIGMVSSLLNPVLLLLVVVWMYSFFDTFNLRAQIGAGTAPQDDYLVHINWHDQRMEQFMLDSHKLLGWGLIALGALVAYQNILMNTLGDIVWRWGQNNPFFRALYLMMDQLPEVVVCVALIICGAWLVRGPKGRKQKPQNDAEDEDFTEYTAQDAQAEPKAKGFAMPKLSALLGKPVTPDDETEDADDGRDEK